MNQVCQLEMTQHEHEQIKQCESVIVREYEREDGSRFAKAVAWGDAAEMQNQASTPTIQIVLDGLSIVGQRAIPVSELLA